MSRIGQVRCWAMISGEYPPDPGGVADYSRQVAEALASRGSQVAVFAPGHAGSRDSGPALVTRLQRGLVMRGLADLGHALDALPSPRRILVQYVPHALGMRSLNLPFCLWLRTRREPVDVFFHEVASPWGPRQSLRNNLLGAGHRIMARLVGARADRVFVSCLGWVPLLRGLGIRRPIAVLPIPSNLPTEVDRTRVQMTRARLDQTGRGVLVGHFGTFGEPVAGMLAAALGELLPRVPACKALMVGRGSQRFCGTLAARQPDLADRFLAADDLSPGDAAEHLAACDVLLQPYPDGVTTRRTTLMTGLALGVPVVSNRGALTEPLWAETDGLAVAATPLEMAELAAALLAEPLRLKALGARGAAIYRDRFHVSHTVEGLIGDRP